jgi:hypothetical protein
MDRDQVQLQEHLAQQIQVAAAVVQAEMYQLLFNGVVMEAQV